MALRDLDPILLEVVRNRLETIADEMELTLLKSAASPIVKEGLDASAALFNVRGETIAQAAAIPIHLGCLELAARRIVEAFPPETMSEGDAFLLNDPYDGGTHLPDITLAVPVVANGRVVALACTMCHHQDVGGRTPGSVPTDATELYQEGLIIPPTRLYRSGVLDANLFALLCRNVRIPEVFTGDLMAQVAAGRLGGIRLNELFSRYGTDTVLGYVEELLERAEILTRRGIEAIPDGTYAFADWMDNDGIDDRPVRIAVAVTVRGSTMTFDFTGTSPQVRGPFNAVPASTLSAVYYAVRAISDPTVPNNGGCFRAVDVVLPPGSLVNPRPPAPVSCRTATIKRIADTILGALVRALPHRMPAASSGTLLVMAFGGTDPETGRPFVASELAAGGMGAAREGRDPRRGDRRDELHEHPGRGARDELPAPGDADRPVGGLRRGGRLQGRARAREGVRGHHDRRHRRAPERAVRLGALGPLRRGPGAARPGVPRPPRRDAGGGAVQEDARSPSGRPAVGVHPGRRGMGGSAGARPRAGPG